MVRAFVSNGGVEMTPNDFLYGGFGGIGRNHFNHDDDNDPRDLE